MRGSGRTSQQIKDAPVGAIFVWCNEGLSYVNALAEHLGRKDVKIVRASYYKIGYTAGLSRPIVIDHAFKD